MIRTGDIFELRLFDRTLATFSEYNLFENKFSAVLSAVAYTGVTSNQAGLTPSTPELSYVPQALAFEQSSHTAAVKSYLSWGIEQFESYASMMVFDALICNTDRHLTNFEFENSERKPFPESYLAKLAQFIRHHAETLAALPPVSREKLHGAMQGATPR